jgi:hypothetical protein
MTAPVRDNSKIILTQQVDQDGNPVGEVANTALLTEIRDILNTPLSETPPPSTELTSELSVGNVSRTGAGETTMAAAVASQTTKLYEYAVTVPGAGTIEIRNGAGGTVLRKHVFPDKGGLHKSFRSRPYAVTGVNTALVFYWSGTGEANIDYDFETSV